MVTYLVIDNELGLVVAVGREDSRRHPGPAGEMLHQGADNLIKTFVNIDAARGNVGPGRALVFKIKLCP